MGGWESIVILGEQILLEGMKFLNRERALALSKELHDIKGDLERAKGLKFPFYSTVRMIIARKRLRIFLEAYHAEIKSVSTPVPQP